MPNNSEEMPSSANIWEGLSERQIRAVSYKLLNKQSTYEEISKALDIPKGTLEKWHLKNGGYVNWLIKSLKTN
jgi:hypothetical protein